MGGPAKPSLEGRVECYAGHRGEETPRRFSFDGRTTEVAEVLDAWLAPDHRYFKVSPSLIGPVPSADGRKLEIQKIGKLGHAAKVDRAVPAAGRHVVDRARGAVALERRRR